MFANYHTHTPRCHHAVGSEREYIEAAIGAGFQVLGFSDHTPMPFALSRPSTVRMNREDAPSYVEILRALQKEYEKDIRILIGFEAEYYPTVFPQMQALYRELGIEYLILGQHYLAPQQGAVYSGHPTDRQAYLKTYVDLVIAGMETGHFTYVAHPDLIHYTGSNRQYLGEMTRLILRAKALSVPLEYNLLGKSGGRNYPDDRFWRLCAELGGTAILGVDAHDPRHLKNRALQEQGASYLSSLGIAQTETPLLRNPV